MDEKQGNRIWGVGLLVEVMDCDAFDDGGILRVSAATFC